MVKNFKKSRNGLTLVEVIISIAIIGIIIVGFLSLFTMSVETNNKSQTTLESIYLGKDTMELIYYLSKNISYKDLEAKLNDNAYTKISENIFGGTFYKRYNYYK